MAKERAGYASGSDAAYIKPKLIPDYELLPRDDSGGPEWDPYTAEFGDGGFVTGDKAHLSAKGGKDDPQSADSDEQDAQYRRGTAKSVNRGNSEAPASSKKMSRE